MKVNLTKISFLFYLFLLTNGKIYAQATDGLPAKGNVYTGAKFLGWGINSGNLDFRTNNVNRMSLLNNTGRLGLGILAPLSMFHISATGASGVGSEVFRTNVTTANSDWRIMANNVERFRISTQINVGEIGTVQNDKLHFITDKPVPLDL